MKRFVSCGASILVVIFFLGEVFAGEDLEQNQAVRIGDTLLFKKVAPDGIKVLEEGKIKVDSSRGVVFPGFKEIEVIGKTSMKISQELQPRVKISGGAYFFYVAIEPAIRLEAPVVNVTGFVPFPMKVEWYPGISLEEVIGRCGGVLPSADPKTIMIKRSTTMSVANFLKEKGKQLEAGDEVYVSPSFF